MTGSILIINHGKQGLVQDQSQTYCYRVIHMPTIGKGADIHALIRQYAVPLIQKKEIVFVSEKMIVSAQNPLGQGSESTPIDLPRSMCVYEAATLFTKANTSP